MEEQEIIESLYKILAELDARNSSVNCIITEFTGHSWIELCDEGINLFQ